MTCEEALQSPFLSHSGTPNKEAYKVLNKATESNVPQDISATVLGILGATNPLSAHAAAIYHKKSQQPVEMCLLLACKMYGGFLWDAGDVQDTLGVDLDEYANTERLILEAMEYCIFI